MPRKAMIFTAEQCAKLEIVASFMTTHDIANCFGISVEAFEDLRKRQPEVDTAYKNGVAALKYRAGSKLIKYIDDPELNQVNLTATIFYLKTKGGWVDASKMMEKEITKVRQDLVDIKTVEDPKELLGRIDKAVSAIDFLIKKEGCAAS